VYLPTVGPAECRTKWWHGPPEFGEQTDEVLAGFGFDARDIAALKKANVA
jgi:crotonobetainyl-CoA:carnitine CoA-transferase CaiB-like acyl-CoA transferase